MAKRDMMISMASGGINVKWKKWHGMWALTLNDIDKCSIVKWWREILIVIKRAYPSMMAK